MSWFNVFRLYNLKTMKKEKLIIIFTMLSILITSTLSVIVPIISANIKNYNENNARKLNGGDLFVSAFYDSKSFNDEIDVLKKEEYKITIKKRTMALFQKDSGRKIYSSIIFGEENLSENEIIIDSSLSKNLSVNVGDKINVVDSEKGKIEYTVKGIEGIPRAVDNDSVILGYGKIGGTLDKGNMFFIEGNTDGEALKERFKKAEDSFNYVSLKDKKTELKNQTDTQMATLSLLTTMGYILSSVVVITTCIMLIVRRKRDISIMKILSIGNQNIKKALKFEMTIIILVPIIISAILSMIIPSFVLKLSYIECEIGLKATLLIVIKGIGLNAVFFMLFSSIPLKILKDIKGISLIREDEGASKIIKRRVFVTVILLIPLVMLVYSIYIQNTANFFLAVGLILFIIIFFFICSILIKLFSIIPYRRNLLIYSFQNIKKNFLSFSLITLSASITVSFILISVSLNKNISSSLNQTLKEQLPYNYIMLSKTDEDLESILTRDNGVEEYTKIYDSNGKVINNNIDSKVISLHEVKKKDYELKFKILEGEDLNFNDIDSCIINSKFKEGIKLEIDDNIEIEVDGKKRIFKIRGVFESSFIGGNIIIVPYNGIGHNLRYYINSSNTKWMDDIIDSPILSLENLGSSFSRIIEKFLRIFKILSVMVIFSSIIFNINIVYITYLQDKKEETIVRALGLGKKFILKYYFIKQAVLVIMSTILAYGLYRILIKGISLLLKLSTNISIVELLMGIVFSTILATAAFTYPFKNINKEKGYEILRES